MNSFFPSQTAPRSIANSSEAVFSPDSPEQNLSAVLEVSLEARLQLVVDADDIRKDKELVFREVLLAVDKVE